MVLEPFTLLRSGPIHKEAVRQMHRPNREPGFLGIAAFVVDEDQGEFENCIPSSEAAEVPDLRVPSCRLWRWQRQTSVPRCRR